MISDGRDARRARNTSSRADRRAIKKGDEGSITVPHDRPSAQLRASSGRDRCSSQADRVGSIPVTRSHNESPGRPVDSAPGL
jgi:hypothetical protein